MYDENGRARADIDYGHNHNKSGDPHYHIWDPWRSAGLPFKR